MTAATKSPGTAIRDFFNSPAGGVALVVLVAICYLLTIQHTYIWDDDAYVTDNPHLRTFAGLSQIWTHIGATPQYYPVTFTSFWLEVQTVGLNPQVSHAINLLLHAASTLLLWTILRKLLVPGAWMAAALFAVHPINVESVAWISERKNTLSMAFGLSALWVYLRYAGLIVVEKVIPAPKPKPAEGEAGEEEEGEGVKLSLPDDPTRLYLIFLALFMCALLSKTTMSVLPVAILVITWWKHGRVTMKDIRPLLLPIGLAFIAGMLTSWIEQHPYINGARGPEWQLGDSWASDKLARLALAGQVSVFYVVKVLLPHTSPNLVHVSESPGWITPYLPWPLMFSYPKWRVNIANPLQWLGTILCIAVPLILWVGRSKLGRGPVAIVLLYFVGLLPAMGFFRIFPQRYSWVADHFAYVGAIALFIGLAALGTIILRRVQAQAREIAGCLVGGVVIVPRVVLSIVHSTSFADAPTLWHETIVRNPRSWWVMLNEANSLVSHAKQMKAEKKDPADIRGVLQSSEIHIRNALKIYPDSYEGYYQLANLARDLGRVGPALYNAQESEKAAARMQQEKFLYPRFMLASLYTITGQFDKAKQIYRDLQPYESKLAEQFAIPFVEARIALATLLKRELEKTPGPNMSEHDRKIVADIIEQYVAASDLLPTAPGPKIELARILMEAGQDLEAARLISEVITVNPNNIDAKYAAALLAIRSGNLTMANNQLVNLVQTNPDYVPGYIKLAEVLNMTGYKKEALERIEQALALEPDNAAAKAMRDQINGVTTQPSTQSTTQSTTQPATLPAPLTPESTTAPITGGND
jgi:tetratricopeptide (TPR) repeat protein